MITKPRLRALPILLSCTVLAACGDDTATGGTAGMGGTEEVGGGGREDVGGAGGIGDFGGMGGVGAMDGGAPNGGAPEGGAPEGGFGGDGGAGGLAMGGMGGMGGSGGEGGAGGDVCNGAPDGTECTPADPCTAAGLCLNGVCQLGAPNCVAGTPVDDCNVETGACDAITGVCEEEPVTDGTPCGVGMVCDATGLCVDIPQVVLNEVEGSGGVPGDWVELYNAGTAAADVSGWTFLDNDDTHTPYVIPAGTIIPVGGFLVLDEASFGFGLGAADSARLFHSNGSLVDSVSWAVHAVTTYGRCPDGTGQFVTATSSTKGAPNDCSVPITLNEIESSGGSPGDWAEIYNAAGIPFDISGWIFRDNDDTHTYVLPAGTIIAANGFLVLDEATFAFGLGSADSARLFDAQGVLVDSHAWTAHAPTTYARCPDGTGTFVTAGSSTKGVSNNCSSAVTINEIESSGGSPGDWVELYNAGAVPFDVSGWVFRDNDDTHVYTLPAGSTIAPAGFLVLDELTFGFGLGAADSARLSDSQGALIDTHSWTAHAAVTLARCPDGTGAITATTLSTKGAINDCVINPAADPWPGPNTVTTVDGLNVLGTNVSGLFYDDQSTDVLWAVRNGPSILYRLVWNGSMWTPDTSNGWSTGRTLRYPNGGGTPDAEDVTKAELASAAVYVSTERDNDVNLVSRLSVLRFDTAASGELLATHEWNLTPDLPAVGANLGLEAITWVPDTALVASSFFDTAAGHAYNPAEYPGHGTGLFFVGVEATGLIYAYALDHDSGTFTRIATIVTGDATVKALSFDRDVGYLWATCGSGCGGIMSILVPDTNALSPTFGEFTVFQQYARPTSMANLTNEGIAMAPESSCVNGQKRFVWTDDGASGGHALRQDAIPCGAFIP